MPVFYFYICSDFGSMNSYFFWGKGVCIEFIRKFIKRTKLKMIVKIILKPSTKNIFGKLSKNLPQHFNMQGFKHLLLLFFQLFIYKENLV